MSTRKTATPRKANAKKQTPPARPHLEAELAAHLAAVLAHPFTPPHLYNAMTDELTDMFTDIPCKEGADTAEHIERVLNWHQGFGFRNVSREGKVK
jgi:hypothetical protein